MNTVNSVEVFLGDTITESSERHLLARLEDDLNRLGVRAQIFANVSFGGGLSQVDFVVVTDHRVVLVEQKTYKGPIVAGPENGPWKVKVGEAEIDDRGNAFRQAVRHAFKLSDALMRFARRHGAPPPTRGKYVNDIDTVVCLYPEIQAGTNISPHRHVDVVGYAELLARVQTDGPRLLWTIDDWDAFRRAQNLYRAGDDSPESALRFAGAAAVDEYRGRFLSAYTDLPRLVSTQVLIDGKRVDRPDVVAALHRGATVQFIGSSEMGKSLWAKTIAAELARSGHVPIWLAADVCEPELLRSTTRAIAPYTNLNAKSLLAASDAAGRPVVFIIDDLTRTSETVANALLRGVNSSRMRSSHRGLLITGKTAHTIAGDTDQLTVELIAPDETERRELLTAYGAEELVGRYSAFTTPLELSMAAECAGDLPQDASVPQLLDRYIDELVDSDDRQRSALRSVALRMHTAVRPALPRPDVARALHRGLDLDDAELRSVFDCRLIDVAHGKVMFRHERFEHFLAAEAIALNAVDADDLARTLNTPQSEPIRNDAIAIISDQTDLAHVLGACESADALAGAAAGALGDYAAAAADLVLSQALSDACAQTTAPGHVVHVDGFSSRWKFAGESSRSRTAQLTAIGQLIIAGRYIDRVGQLFDVTDELCSRTVASADTSMEREMLDNVLFASTYVLGPGQLPASVILQSAVSAAWNAGPLDAVVEQLLAGDADQQIGGRFYLACELLRRSTRVDLATELAVRAMETRRYHLHLAGLALGQRFAYRLEDDNRDRIVSAARKLFDEDNIMLNTAIVETLESLDAIDAAKDLADVHREIQTILELEDVELSQQMAYGAYSAQFETSAIGPYYEGIQGLDAEDGLRLRALALAGMPDYSSYGDLILSELGKLGGMEDPAAVAAVDAVVARSNPSKWMDQQSGMAYICTALGLLAQAERPLPPPAAGGTDDPAWWTFLELILAVTGALYNPENSDRVTDAWSAFLGRHRDTLASSLVAVAHAHRFTEPVEDVHQMLLDSMPPQGLEALIWSVEHPDQNRTVFRWDRAGLQHAITVLGELGDPRAATVLRRHAADGAEASAAIEAIRKIEMRAAR
jgi:hypothetical protein